MARYEVVTVNRAGIKRAHRYSSESDLVPGSVLRLDGRDWLVERAEQDGDDVAARVFAKPARYRLRLRHPDASDELGAFRRFRPGAPRLGHFFTTIEDGRPVSWEVRNETLARDEEGAPYLELVAERDFGELEELPNHELEHALAGEDDLPEAATATFERAEGANLSVELVALDPGEEPDWAEAREYIDALILEEIEDDLLELCGVKPDADPRERWLEIVKDRLRADLERFQADIEGDHDEIEEWDFRDGRIFASVGNLDDEGDPDKGHGWMCRLVDVSALATAGFQRVRKAQLA